jgi:hypothetical protein
MQKKNGPCVCVCVCVCVYYRFLRQSCSTCQSRVISKFRQMQLLLIVTTCRGYCDVDKRRSFFRLHIFASLILTMAMATTAKESSSSSSSSSYCTYRCSSAATTTTTTRRRPPPRSMINNNRTMMRLLFPTTLVMLLLQLLLLLLLLSGVAWGRPVVRNIRSTHGELYLL